MDEKKYADAMQIILHAGNAKAAALAAIDLAAEGDFGGAQSQLDEAQHEILEAHHLQLALVQGEAAGEPVEVNIILVHAQDHLSLAFAASDMAERFIALYRRLAAVEAWA